MNKQKKKKGEQEEVNANKRGVSGLSFGGTPTFINWTEYLATKIEEWSVR